MQTSTLLAPTSGLVAASQLPSRREALAFLEDLDATSARASRTWNSHVNATIMAGGRPASASVSDLAERCFDTFVDHLYDVLVEAGALPLAGPLRRFQDMDLARDQGYAIVDAALARTTAAYALESAQTEAA